MYTHGEHRLATSKDEKKKRTVIVGIGMAKEDTKKEKLWVNYFFKTK